MRLVQVDVVGLQPAQRAVDRLHDVLAGQAAVVAAGAGRPVDLGEDLQPLAALALQRPAEDRLGPGAGVDVGGVEGGDAEVEGGADAGGGGVLLDLGAVGDPVAVRDLADEQAGPAEMTKLHAREPNRRLTAANGGQAARQSIGRVSASNCSSSSVTALRLACIGVDQRLPVAADRAPPLVRRR